MTNREINHENQPIRALISKKQLIHDMFIVLVVGILLGFLAPFGMNEVPLVWAVFYWIFTCACGYFIFMPCTQLGERYLIKIVPHYFGRLVITMFIASIVMSFFVPFSVWLFFDIAINYQQQFWQVFPKVIVIGGILTFIGFVKDYIHRQNSKLNESEQLIEQQLKKNASQDDLQLEKFMAQLPVDKRGKLYCLEMSDHYLKVYTDKGHHLLLMRFKDALELLSDYKGIQTHRSWWVALDAIVKVNKDGRKISLQLSNQLQVPVSRTYAEAIRAADIH
ncbi:LytTR family DNA-binding domain-containing protein [Thalassotalea fonticola]|uniref:LytTR family DNA-binding domain-containing protein n=1 Tax=Thalassotalea fonticola TaxID=3065649 RepID=A0ABZ0GQ15_9GAMM|nr:LytTR family DNA-binding domain-containing protein [Colwelliaceae bacterium S1-1]